MLHRTLMVYMGLVVGLWFLLMDNHALAAEAAGKAPTPAEVRQEIEALNQRLAERDALIVSLLQRVRQLEVRLDTPTNAGATATAATSTAPPRAVPVASQTPQASPTENGSSPAQTPTPKPSGPGTFEVDPEAAERALERTLTQAGALLLPVGKADFEPSVRYTRRTQEVPLFARVDGLLFLTGQDVRRNELTADMELRVGLPWDSQVELGLPYNYVAEDRNVDIGTVGRFSESREGNAIGDFRVGFAKTLFRERGRRPDLIARLTYDSDTGDKENNLVALAGGFNEIRGELVALKRQDPLAFVASAFYEKAFGDEGIEPGDATGFSLGVLLAASPETSLQFNYSQVFKSEIELNGRKISGSDQVQGIFSVGASSILTRGVLLNGSLGVGLGEDAPEYFFRLSLPIRFDVEW